MATIFSVNENNDIFAENGRIQLKTGRDAVLQHTVNSLRTRRGELIYSTSRGIPYLEAVFSGGASLLEFEAEARLEISSLADVTAIENFSVTLENNTINYRVSISTTFGSGAIDVSI